MAMANNYANRLTRVVNGPDPNQLNQNLSEEDQIAQQSMITRLVILITMFFCYSPAVPIVPHWHVRILRPMVNGYDVFSQEKIL